MTVRTLISALLLSVVFLTAASAQQKFSNKDTAKNRQDNVFGTRKAANKTADIYISQPAGQDTVISSQPREKEAPVDWYDKVLITVNPNVDWPSNQTSTTTTTNSGASFSNASGVFTNSTSTTKIVK